MFRADLPGFGEQIVLCQPVGVLAGQRLYFHHDLSPLVIGLSLLLRRGFLFRVLLLLLLLLLCGVRGFFWFLFRRVVLRFLFRRVIVRFLFRRVIVRLLHRRIVVARLLLRGRVVDRLLLHRRMVVLLRRRLLIG